MLVDTYRNRDHPQQKTALQLYYIPGKTISMMFKRIAFGAAAALIAASSFAQYNNGNQYGNGVDQFGNSARRSPFGSRSSSLRDNRQPNQTPAPGQSPTPASGRNGRATPTPRSTSRSTYGSSRSSSTSGTKTLGKPGSPAAAKPGTAAGSGAAANAPVSTGHVKEVTRGFIESIRTRKVEYDENEMRQNPGVIILNPRKYKADDTDQQQERGADRHVPLSQPL